MTAKQKAQFELINNSLWLLVKNYIKDAPPYKTIMGDLFNMYCAYDNSDVKFTDAWWEEVIKKFTLYAEKYKKTALEDFAGELALGFCDVWEQEKKGNADYLTYYSKISRAFIKEWGRLREKEDTAKAAG